MRGGPYKGGFHRYFDPYLPYRVGIAETSSMGVMSEQITIQVYVGKVINSHYVMFITLWCGGLAVSIIIRIFVLMP